MSEAKFIVDRIACYGSLVCPEETVCPVEKLCKDKFFADPDEGLMLYMKLKFGTALERQK